MLDALLIGLGIAFALEGLAYALLPGGMKKMLSAMMDEPEEKLRLFGLICLSAGVFIVWLAT